MQAGLAVPVDDMLQFSQIVAQGLWLVSSSCQPSVGLWAWRHDPTAVDGLTISRQDSGAVCGCYCCPALHACRVFGPQRLKTIAAAVLQQMLTQKLDSLEAAQAQGHCSSDSGCKAQVQDARGCCSLVCVQACSSDDSEAGRSTVLPRMCSTHSADVDLIVVQADVSAESTPASSRAASPDSNDGFGAVESAAERSGRSGHAAANCCSPARSNTRKSVAFSTLHAGQPADAADKPTCCAEEPAVSLPTASSSGWYDELCCVCWESEVTAVMEPCMHAMCLGCARQLVSCKGTAGPQCPLCRAYIAGFGPVPPSERQQEGKRKKSLLAGAGI
jgi:hypothetical protein